jgi:hypothetical protein
VLRFSCASAKDAVLAGAINNPELPQYIGRIIVWAEGSATGGKPRGIATCGKMEQARWICDRLNLAEKHSPWSGGKIPW